MSSIGGYLQLSVVIPHFGTPELLDRCVASVPVRDDVELIVVQDDEQKGAGWARNVGLKMAKGRWITFVDADDYLPGDFGRILDVLAEGEGDILFFRNMAVQSGNAEIASTRENYEQCFRRYFESNDESSLRFQMCSLWGKFFSKEFIDSNQIMFDETRWSNDVFFSLQAGYLARTIKVYPDIAYVLTEHPGSLTSDFCKSEEEWQTRFSVLRRKYDYLSERGIEKWADEYRWLLNKLIDIDFRRFLEELRSLRGTHYYKGTLLKILKIRLKMLMYE